MRGGIPTPTMSSPRILNYKERFMFFQPGLQLISKVHTHCIKHHLLYWRHAINLYIKR